MTFEDFNYARMALKKFVETEMEPGDLVSIIRTDGDAGIWQKFVSDKQLLLSRIGRMICAHSGCASATMYTIPGLNLSFDGVSAMNPSISLKDPNLSRQPSIFDLAAYSARYNLSKIFEIMQNASIPIRLAALGLAIQSLQEAPGRKSVILLTPAITYYNQNDQIIENSIKRTADRALRAGVVIHTMDIKGVTFTENMNNYNKHLPLSPQTGGIIVENSNFFIHGIKPVEEYLRGYYLLSYTPPPGSFNEKEKYHKVKVKVKGSKGEVHTRAGFFETGDIAQNILDPAPSSAWKAVDSSFRYSDIELRLTAGYGYTPDSGYFVKSWLHLNGNDLTLAKENDGSRYLSLEFAFVLSTAEHIPQDTQRMRREFKIDESHIAQLKENGLNFEMDLPINKPGNFFYVRAAIKDITSGKVGSAYQFLEIPTLKNRKLALSSIFVLPSAESSIALGKVDANALKSSQSEKSPALRIYRPGDSIDYVLFVYNSEHKKRSPELELQCALFKNGQPYSRSEMEDVEVGQDPENIKIRKTLVLDRTMEEGDYLLQLIVRDKQGLLRSNTQIQAIDFQIRK
jgi:VWFA-related protein